MSAVEAPLLVISPHLDDAVFACGALLAEHAGATVATVFAGRPSETERLREWDHASGFSPGDDVIGARRAEDCNALALLGATPLWLDFLDSQYGATPRVEEIAIALQEVLKRHAPQTVLFPLGLFHSDHVLTYTAAMELMSRDMRHEWLAYEDALYRRVPETLETRLNHLKAAGWHAEPLSVQSSATARALKRQAVQAYGSQLRALATPGRPGHEDLEEEESFWRLQRVS